MKPLLSQGGLAQIPIDVKAAQAQLGEAKVDLMEVEGELREGKVKWVIIKSYYAMFEAARALLYVLGLKAQEFGEHAAIGRVLKQLAYRGKLEQRYAADFSAMKDAREKANYDNTYPAQLAPYAVKTASEFIKEMERQVARITRARPGQ